MVYANKRSKSPATFLKNTDELLYKSIDMCTHCPKKYRYIITDEIMRLTNETHSCVFSANHIYINQYTSKKDYELKMRFWILARSNLKALEKKVNIFYALARRNNDFYENKKNYTERFEDWILQIKGLERTLNKLSENDKKKFGSITKKSREKYKKTQQQKEENVAYKENIKKHNQQILDDCDI